MGISYAPFTSRVIFGCKLSDDEDDIESWSEKMGIEWQLSKGFDEIAEIINENGEVVKTFTDFTLIYNEPEYDQRELYLSMYIPDDVE